MEKKTGMIYKATSPSGKMYIGQTVDLEQRKSKHQSDARKFTYAFANAINKYGIDGFVWEIIEDNITINELNKKEEYYINKFDTYENGYNSTEGGDFNPMMYQKLRDKVSRSKTGKKMARVTRGEDRHTSKLKKIQVEKIRELYSSGLYSQQKLSNMFSVSRETVREVVKNRTWIDESYIPKTHDRRKHKEDFVKEIVEKYKTGKHSSLSLAEKYGVSFQTICYILNKNIDDDIRKIKESNMAGEKRQRAK